MAIIGCSQETPGAPARSQAATSRVTAPKPASTDENQWGTYLVDQGKAYHPDTGMRQVYVIPGGDGDAAERRREDEIRSISGGINTLLMPGSLLILGGPDGRQTGDFVAALAKELKPDSLKGIVVMIVTNADQKSVVDDALKMTGAKVQFVVM
jgi:hypothetical protein